LVIRYPAIKTSNLPPKQVDKSAAIGEEEGERKAARINTGLPANITWIAVAFN